MGHHLGGTGSEEAMTLTPSSAQDRALLALGALAAAFYVVAQISQAVLNRTVPPSASDPAAEIAVRLLAADRVRQWLILASLVVIPIAYAALAAACWTHAPGTALVGLSFGVLFSGFECGYRSVDLFAGARWAAEFVATADGVKRAAILERFDLWEGAIRALYLPLLAAHALSSAAFAAAVGFRQGTRWDHALALALAANSVRALLRIGQMHLGVAALAPVNGAIYLPVTLLTYGMLAAWLVRSVRSLPERGA
jgi:hypothetical protein